MKHFIASQSCNISTIFLPSWSSLERNNASVFFFIFVFTILEVKFPYEPLCPYVEWSVCWSSVGWLVRRRAVIIDKKGRKLHFCSPIGGALVLILSEFFEMKEKRSCFLHVIIFVKRKVSAPLSQVSIKRLMYIIACTIKKISAYEEEENCFKTPRHAKYWDTAQRI